MPEPIIYVQIQGQSPLRIGDMHGPIATAMMAALEAVPFKNVVAMWVRLDGEAPIETQRRALPADAWWQQQMQEICL